MLFALANLLIGFGSSATFAPLIADISHWFTRRRGIAVAICAAGNYLGGAIWPPVVQRLIETYGWRTNQIVVGIVCIALMLPLALVLRRRLAAQEVAAADAAADAASASLGLNPYALFALLCLAGVACCVAMSMPQVHIVAYCADLGYGVARGAEMLSLMLGFGIVSRIASGFVADRIGGLATLLIGSILQGVALFLYLLFDGLTPLYVISALFGLFQGGIVPMYAIIVREYFPPQARRHAGRAGDHVDHPRHGARRLAVGRDLRPDRLLLAGVRQRARLEPAQRRCRAWLLMRRNRLRLAPAQAAAAPG